MVTKKPDPTPGDDTAPITDTTTEPTTEIPSNQAEIDALRAEVARLQALSQVPPASVPAERGRTGWWRPVVSTVLIVLLGVLLPLGVVARWVNNEVAGTDRYVESVAPLAKDKAIQDAVVTRITNEIMTKLEVEAVTSEAIDALSGLGLPPLAATSLKALSGPLQNAIHDFVEGHVRTLVESPAFQQAWEDANRVAHSQLVAVLTGEGTDTVSVDNNAVVLNLAPVIDQVKTRLVDNGFALAGQLPSFDVQMTLFESEDLTTAQNAFRVLKGLNTALPIVALLLLAGALAVARSRRKTLIAAMLVCAASMLLLGVALNAFRVVYLQAIPSDLSQPAAAAVYDNMVWFIRLNLRALLVLTLAVAFIAWVSGAGRSAVAVRGGAGSAIGWVRSGTNRAGLDTGRLGIFLDTYRSVIRGVVLGLALLVYVMEDHPTGGFTITVLLVAAVVLLITELLARPPAVAAADVPDGGPPPAAPGPS
jgi:hypothetical protein